MRGGRRAVLLAADYFLRQSIEEDVDASGVVFATDGSFGIQRGFAAHQELSHLIFGQRKEIVGRELSRQRNTDLLRGHEDVCGRMADDELNYLFLKRPIDLVQAVDVDVQETGLDETV